MAEEPSAAAAVATAVEDEVGLLVKEILRVSGGVPSVTYGALAKDDLVANTFEALLGTLKAARKRGIVSFEGELLLMGQHDDVVISLVSQEPAAPAQPAAAAEEEEAKELAEAEPAVPATAAPVEEPEPPVAAPAQPEPVEEAEEAGETAVEEAPAEEEPTKPSAAVPPPAVSPPAAPMPATPPPAAPAAEEDAPAAEDEKKGWSVDTSYIDYRTQDPNRLEGRRSDDNLDKSPADAVTATAAAASAAASSATTKGEDGRWQQVDVSYINHRTGDCDRLEPRRAAGDGPAAAAAPLTSPAVAPGPSSTVKKEDGKWQVDTSYINHRTGDTSNMTKIEQAADSVTYSDPAETKHPYEALKGQRPSDVNPATKELYLSDAEFKTVMGMTPAEFQKMPKWKQQNLKKAKEIF